jgi:hypothetical protein
LCLVVSVELNARGETLCVLRRENGDEWNYVYESGELVAVAPTKETKGPKSNRKQTGPMLAHPAPGEWAHERSRRLATEKRRGAISTRSTRIAGWGNEPGRLVRLCHSRSLAGDAVALQSLPLQWRSPHSVCVVGAGVSRLSGDVANQGGLCR